jgi:hypothetical protein
VTEATVKLASATSVGTKWPKGTARSTPWTPPCARRSTATYPNLRACGWSTTRCAWSTPKPAPPPASASSSKAPTSTTSGAPVGVSENIIEASWIALVDAIEYKLHKDERGIAAPGDRARSRDPAAALATNPATINAASRRRKPSDLAVFPRRFPTASITPRPPSRASTPLGRARLFSREPIRAQAVHDRHSAAERDRRAAPGACAEQHAAGHPHPHEADAGLQRALDAGHRPRGHRHAGGRRAAAAGEEEGKTRHDLGREKLVERIWQWKDEYEPASSASSSDGLQLRLAADAVHARRRSAPAPCAHVLRSVPEG